MGGKETGKNGTGTGGRREGRMGGKERGEDGGGKERVEDGRKRREGRTRRGGKSGRGIEGRRGEESRAEEKEGHDIHGIGHADMWGHHLIPTLHFHIQIPLKSNTHWHVLSHSTVFLSRHRRSMLQYERKQYYCVLTQLHIVRNKLLEERDSSTVHCGLAFSWLS